MVSIAETGCVSMQSWVSTQLVLRGAPDQVALKPFLSRSFVVRSMCFVGIWLRGVRKCSRSVRRRFQIFRVFSSRAVAYIGRHLDMSWSIALGPSLKRSLTHVEENGRGIVFGSSENLSQKLGQKVLFWCYSWPLFLQFLKRLVENFMRRSFGVSPGAEGSVFA